MLLFFILLHTSYITDKDVWFLMYNTSQMSAEVKALLSQDD